MVEHAYPILCSMSGILTIPCVKNVNCKVSNLLVGNLVNIYEIISVFPLRFKYFSVCPYIPPGGEGGGRYACLLEINLCKYLAQK